MGPDGAQIMVHKPGTGGVLLIINSYVNANLSNTTNSPYSELLWTKCFFISGSSDVSSCCDTLDFTASTHV